MVTLDACICEHKHLKVTYICAIDLVTCIGNLLVNIVVHVNYILLYSQVEQGREL